MKDDPQVLSATKSSGVRALKVAGAGLLAGMLLFLLATKAAPNRLFPQREPVYFWHTCEQW